MHKSIAVFALLGYYMKDPECEKRSWKKKTLTMGSRMEDKEC